MTATKLEKAVERRVFAKSAEQVKATSKFRLFSEACEFSGSVIHERVLPRGHKFQYPMSYVYLPLGVADDEAETNSLLNRVNIPGRFRRSDYFGDNSQTLATSVLQKASDLAGKPVGGQVAMLGQLSWLGFYFSPVNFYLIESHDSAQVDMVLAEVTNTPWGEKHCYLIDLQNSRSLIHDKEFHVSPFNPMQMQYRWRIHLSQNRVAIRIHCLRYDSRINLNQTEPADNHQPEREFTAGFAVSRQQESAAKGHYRLNGLRILIAIYWQALRLFLKRTPIYDHPKTRSIHEAA